MPTTATLRTQRHARFCYLWLLDGCELAFTDNAILTTGDFTGEGHDIRAYLETDGMQVEEALDLRSGRLDETTSTFVLVDFDAILGQLFAAEAEDEEPLEQSVYPADDLAARVELHGMHVGTEAIGPSGERGQWPCVPGFNFAQMHIGLDQELPQHRPAPVTSSPIVWRGRRCALYRCYVDTDGTRRPFAEAERIWWGSMTDQGRVDGRRWELEVAGPQSWLQRDLGVLTQRDPVFAIGTLELSDAPGQDETRIGVLFNKVSAGAGLNEIYGERLFVASITGDVPADIIADISAELQTAQNTAGTDGAFTDANNRYVSIDGLGRFTIHTDPDTDAIARMRLTLHRKVWQALGYDPIAQRAAEGADFVAFSYYDVDGEGMPNELSPHGPAPGAGYITATIDTKAATDEANGDNDGLPRQYRPLYSGGVTVLLANGANGNGQIIDLDNGLGGSSIYVRGQWSQPVASDPDAPEDPYPLGAGANRQGLWLFYGKRRLAGVGSGGTPGPEFDEYWVGRASWRSGSLQQQGLVLGGRIVVTEWLPPRVFGYDRPLPESDWVGRANANGDYRIRAVPILALDYRGSAAYERAHVVIERLLRSTGTAGPWSSYALDPAAQPSAGTNNSAGTPPRDAEVEDLGLAIPGDMIANVLAFGLEGDALPQGLGDVKVAFGPGMAADQLLEGLMRPFGWAWSLRDGVYGIFTPSRPPSPDAVDFELDGSTKLGTGGEGSISQDLRAFAPIDRFKLRYSYAAHLEKFTKELVVDSKDTGRRYRHGGIEETQPAHGVRTTEGWPTRSRDLGVWWARRHFFVRSWPSIDRVPRHVGEYARITDPRGFDPSGVYGIDDMMAVVTRVVTTLRPGSREPFTALDVLVYAGSAGLPRLHAFAGRGIGIDTSTNRVYTAENWLGFPHPDWSGDASYFIEGLFPGLAAVGDEADVSICQWNGSAWEAPLAVRYVRGAGVDGNGPYVELDAYPTGYRHKMDTLIVLTPRGSQTGAWVLERYGVTCSKAGTFDGGTPGPRWEDV